MKKIVIAFICLSVLLTLCVSATNVRGDVDGSGSRSVVDVLQVVRSLINKESLQGSDVNRDGKINLLDAVYLFEMVATDAKDPEGVEGMTLLEFVSEAHSPKAAGDKVMQGMIRITSDEMKGTHDADHIYVNGKVYAAYEANNEKPGDPGTYEKEYAALAIIDLENFTVDSIEKFAWGEQVAY